MRRVNKLSIIDQDYIYVDFSVDSSNDLFEKIGEVLIENGIVKDSYITALKEREEEFPTGLPLPIGVAIPHTEGIYVNEDKLVIATLSEPIKFVEMGSDDVLIDVSLIIMIVMKDGKSHLEMLQNIIGTVQNQELVSQIMNEKNTETIKQLLEQSILG